MRTYARARSSTSREGSGLGALMAAGSVPAAPVVACVYVKCSGSARTTIGFAQRTALSTGGDVWQSHRGEIAGVKSTFRRAAHAGLGCTSKSEMVRVGLSV